MKWWHFRASPSIWFLESQVRMYNSYHKCIHHQFMRLVSTVQLSPVLNCTGYIATYIFMMLRQPRRTDYGRTQVKVSFTIYDIRHIRFQGNRLKNEVERSEKADFLTEGEACTPTHS